LAASGNFANRIFLSFNFFLHTNQVISESNILSKIEKTVTGEANIANR
jgi:hypothetical protein